MLSGVRMSDNENASDSSFDGYGFEMVGLEDIEKSDNERDDNGRENENDEGEDNGREDNGRENNERESSSDGYNTDDDIEYDKETGTMLIFKHYDSEAEYGDNESDVSAISVQLCRSFLMLQDLGGSPSNAIELLLLPIKKQTDRNRQVFL